MIDFSEFKKQVCNFYRRHTHLHYWIYVDDYWQDIVVRFKIDNVAIVYFYELSTEYINIEQRNKKAEMLMKEISKDLQGIKNEC